MFIVTLGCVGPPTVSQRGRFDPGLLSSAKGTLWGVDAVTKFLARIVAWINAGYPEGVPGPDRVPLLALLRRRLTDDEVKAVVAALIDNAVRAEPEVRAGGIDSVDIGVQITQIIDDLPSPDDVERVRERLAAKGWPLDDPRDAESDTESDAEADEEDRA